MFSCCFKSKTLPIFAGIACLIMSLTNTASAQEPVSLFKIVTVKDEIVVGLTASEIAELGGGDVSAIGKALAANGELSLWQFAVRKAADGSLEEAPLRRVSILGHESLRIEAYATPLRVLPVE